MQNAAEPVTLAVFWFSLAGLLWTFLGYPALMLLRAAARGGAGERPAVSDAPAPSVSVLLAVRNAAPRLEARLENLLAQDYPSDRLEIVVCLNGCTDASEAIARAAAARCPERVRVLATPAGEGKAGALNGGAAAARGEVLVFADVRQRFEPDAVRKLAAWFADPQIGAVSGRLIIEAGRGEDVAGVAHYWAFETRLRWAESRTGSVVGATGAIYAVRRALYRPLPAGVILDDVYLPLEVVRQGRRVAFEPDALAYDRPSVGVRAEYRRRVRTMVGNLELLRLMPDLLVPWRNPVFVRYVSHKLLRVLAPLFSIALLASAIVLPGALNSTLAGALLGAHLLGALGLILPTRFLALPTAFLLLHAAGLSALLRPRRTAAELWS